MSPAGNSFDSYVTPVNKIDTFHLQFLLFVEFNSEKISVHSDFSYDRQLHSDSIFLFTFCFDLTHPRKSSPSLRFPLMTTIFTPRYFYF
jgi:hypothetical protein